jgi:hypothetical protein
VIGECERLGIGVLAIRVYAGALAGQPPAAHSHDKVFPLPVYERSQKRAAALARDCHAG